MVPQRERIILTLKKIQSGELDINQVKKLLNAPEIAGTLPAPWPEGKVMSIPIKTTFEHVLLNYPPDPNYLKYLEVEKLVSNSSHVEVHGIAVCKRQDDRFKNLEPDTEYIISIPEPGIEVYTLARYQGPMQIKQVMTEADFIW